jgi:hypothetical protein
MLKKISIVILLVFFSKNSEAQNESNVPYQSLVAINPSFAGSNGFVRNQLFVQSPASHYLNYLSCNNAFDVYLPSLKSGVALSTNYYQYSTTYRNISGAFSYAKYFKLNEDLKIIPSIRIGYTNRQIYAPYIWKNGNAQASPNYPWLNSNYFSVGGGLLANYKNFYGGVSVLNINRPDVGIYTEEKTNPLYNFHASYNLKISDMLLFNLYAQISARKDQQNQSIAFNALIFKHLIYGVGYRWRDMGVMNIGYRTNSFVVQLAYNRNLSVLRPSDRRYDYWQFIMSFNLRNNAQRNTLTSFEAW